MDSAETKAPAKSFVESHLKAHKELPKKSVSGQYVDPAIPSHGLAFQADSSSPNGLSFPNTAPSLPLTPPTVPPEPNKQSSASLVVETPQLKSSDATPKATPSRQADLLTPDITPPRRGNRKRPAPYRDFPSASSRADSFKTAPEAFASDDDAETVRGTEPVTSPISGVENVENFSSPPADTRHTRSTQIDRPNSQGKTHLTSRVNNSTSPNVPTSPNTLRKERLEEPIKLPKVRKKQKANDKEASIEMNEVSPRVQPEETQRRRLSSLPNFEKSLRERMKEMKASNTPTLEEFGREIGWFPADNQKRNSQLSAVSTTSTVEAIIIDSPPKKRQTLRHTGKGGSLRSTNSPVAELPGDIPVTPKALEQEHRLVRKPARITDQDRRSIASDNLSFTMAQLPPKPKQPEIIRVVVIPQRRSSLSTSINDSGDHSRNRFSGENRRPNTAPDSRARSRFNSGLPKRRRTVSESASQSQKSKTTTRQALNGRPKIPSRRSSLSAPTSANPSRTASLTSDNLQRYQLAQEKEKEIGDPKSEETRDLKNAQILVPATVQVQQPVVQAPTPSNDTPDSLAVEIHPNNLLLQTPPLPKTPFQTSIHSLSPGPIEISEARAVPFFSHNNRSLVVIEQLSQGESRAVQRLRTSPTDLGVVVAEPQTPTMDDRDEKSNIDSPLRNPRPPPKPPAFKVTPATPLRSANVRPPYHLSSSSTESGNGLTKRWDSLRRSLSTKRYSDPRTTSEQIQVQNRKAGKEIDSKLHPFWRPRGFWEDFKDSDVDGELIRRKPVPQSTAGTGDVYIGNSLGIPQKRTLQGPLSLIRRVSSRRRAKAKNTSHTSIISTTVSLSSRRGRNRTLFQLFSIRELQAWLARSRSRRERENLEARRNKLRHMIGPRVTVDPNSVVARYSPQPMRSAFDS